MCRMSHLEAVIHQPIASASLVIETPDGVGRSLAARRDRVHPRGHGAVVCEASRADAAAHRRGGRNMVSSAHTSVKPIASSQMSVTPPVATKRVVYFVASHVNPEQILRLIRACRSGAESSRVLVHHDHKCSKLDASQVRAIDNVDMPDLHVPIRWGGLVAK